MVTGGLAKNKTKETFTLIMTRKFLSFLKYNFGDLNFVVSSPSVHGFEAGGRSEDEVRFEGEEGSEAEAVSWGEGWSEAEAGSGGEALTWLIARRCNNACSKAPL